jgi:predicted RNA-binding protein with PUA-like domain
MALWLFKEEPDHYNFADLERDGETLWDGVSNNLALKHLRAVKKGDRILYYHTGKEKAVVGEMVALADAKAADDDERGVVVRVRAVRRWPKSVTLERIKQEASLKEWELVRLPRLSVLPLTEVQWRKVEALARGSDKG